MRPYILRQTDGAVYQDKAVYQIYDRGDDMFPIGYVGHCEQTPGRRWVVYLAAYEDRPLPPGPEIGRLVMRGSGLHRTVSAFFEVVRPVIEAWRNL